MLYLGMAALSLATVVLSLLGNHCPPTSFYVLEVIINAAMIIEVAIRVVAFGNVRFLTLLRLPARDLID